MSVTNENFCPNCGSELKPVQTPSSKDYFADQDLHYDCIICGFRYSYVPVAETDSKSDKYDCPVCNKHFNQLGSLKRHLALHSGERPFMCNECDKTFKTRAALKRHTIIHTGELPFECSTCKRRFNQISNLRKHLVIHSNNCPFYCEVCGKGFNQLSNLKKHMAVHRAGEMTSNQPSRPPRSAAPKMPKKQKERPVLTFVKSAES